MTDQWQDPTRQEGTVMTVQSEGTLSGGPLKRTHWSEVVWLVSGILLGAALTVAMIATGMFKVNIVQSVPATPTPTAEYQTTDRLSPPMTLFPEQVKKDYWHCDDGTVDYGYLPDGRHINTGNVVYAVAAPGETCLVIVPKVVELTGNSKRVYNLMAVTAVTADGNVVSERAGNITRDIKDTIFIANVKWAEIRILNYTMEQPVPGVVRESGAPTLIDTKARQWFTGCSPQLHWGTYSDFIGDDRVVFAGADKPCTITLPMVGPKEPGDLKGDKSLYRAALRFAAVLDDGTVVVQEASYDDPDGTTVTLPTNTVGAIIGRFYWAYTK